MLFGKPVPAFFGSRSNSCQHDLFGKIPDHAPPKFSGSEGLPAPQPRVGPGCMRQRESLIGVAWGARPKPGPASPANVSKRGLFARHYVPNQTLIMVNARLPKGNLAAGNQGNSGGYGRGNRVPKADSGPLTPNQANRRGPALGKVGISQRAAVGELHAAALSSLSAPRATIFRASSGNGRCNALASPTARAATRPVLRP